MALVGLFAIATTVVLPVSEANATVSAVSVSATPNPSIAGTSSVSWTVSFDSTHALDPLSIPAPTITVTFPFDASGAGVSSVTNCGVPPGDTVGGPGNTQVTITLTPLCSGITAGTTVTVVLTGISAPQGTYGENTFSVETSADLGAQPGPTTPPGTDIVVNAAPSATSVSSISFTPGNSTALATSNWTVQFTPATALASSDTITLTFGSVGDGFGLPSPGPATVALSGAVTSCSGITSGTVSGQSVTVTLGGSCSISTSPVTVTVDSITNPSPGSFTNTDFSVVTSQDTQAASPTTNVDITKANQLPLTITSTSGTFGTPLTLATIGGSGTGLVGYVVVNGTAQGCAINSGALSATTAGTCLVTATKASDTNYFVQSSPQTTVTLYSPPPPPPPAQAQTTTTLTVTPNPARVGQVVTLSVSVTSGIPASAVTSGTVTFTTTAGTINGCASVQLASGTATCTTSFAQRGSYVLGASFAGNSNYATSSAGTVTLVVGGGDWFASASTADTACVLGGAGSSTGNPCGLSSALSVVDPGETIELTTSGSAGSYVGHFALDAKVGPTSGPVTIEPAAGVVDPIIDGSHSGTVLNVASGGHYVITGVAADGALAGITLQNGQGTGSSLAGGKGGNGGTGANGTAGRAAGGKGGNGGKGGVGASAVNGESVASAGIFNAGTLVVDHCTVTGNSGLPGGKGGNGGSGGAGGRGARGGNGGNGGDGGSGGNGGNGGPAIYNSGNLTIDSCTLTNNSGGAGGAAGAGGDGGDKGAGGGPDASAGNLGNPGVGGFVGRGGAGIMNSSIATLALNDCTLTGAGGAGANGSAGPDIDNLGSLSVEHCTVSAASSGGAAIHSTGTFSLVASLLAESCTGVVSDRGYNAASADSGCLNHGPGDVSDPSVVKYLSALASNGGPTQTVLAQIGNKALGAIPFNTSVTVGSNSFTLCPTTDQRGVTSPAGTACDIGAAQASAPAPAVSSPPKTPTSTCPTLGAATDERFVCNLYFDLLKRSVTSSSPGAASFIQGLTAGLPRSFVATAVLNSAEYHQRLIDQYFETYLNRAPGDAASTAFLGQLSGGATTALLQVEICSSAEFSNAHSTDTEFVTALYKDILNRDPDAAGLATFLNYLSNSVPRANVAAAILSSPEHYSDLVQDWYHEFLGRAADNSGLQSFIDLLGSGEGAESAMATILASAEYFAK
jgi:hypothetical protein